MARGQIITGSVTVVASGSPRRLSNMVNYYVRDLKVMGNSGNTAGIVVGDENVSFAPATQRGVYAGRGGLGESPHVTIAGPVDLFTVLVDATTGDKAIFFAIECDPPGA